MNKDIIEAFRCVEKPILKKCFITDSEEWSAAKGYIYQKNCDNLCMADFDESFGLMELISVFSELGFQYYLPRLIKIAQEEEDGHWSVVTSIFNLLTVSDINKHQIPNLIGYIKILTPDQNRCLRDFISESIEVDGFISPLLAQSALTNLENRTMIPYAQKKLEEWSHYRSAQ